MTSSYGGGLSEVAAGAAPATVGGAGVTVSVTDVRSFIWAEVDDLLASAAVGAVGTVVVLLLSDACPFHTKDSPTCKAGPSLELISAICRS